jgi:hypothetical protein
LFVFVDRKKIEMKEKCWAAERTIACFGAYNYMSFTLATRQGETQIGFLYI